jgi:hypothetical protein
MAVYDVEVLQSSQADQRWENGAVQSHSSSRIKAVMLTVGEHREPLTLRSVSSGYVVRSKTTEEAFVPIHRLLAQPDCSVQAICRTSGSVVLPCASTPEGFVGFRVDECRERHQLVTGFCQSSLDSQKLCTCVQAGKGTQLGAVSNV